MKSMRILAVVAGLMLGLGAASAPAAPGPWLNPPATATPPGVQAEQPQIAIGPDGTATAVWRKLGGPTGIIQASTRPAGGEFGAPVDISDPAHDSLQPQVAVAPDGTVTVAWKTDGYGSGDNVYVATKPAGGSFDDPIPLAEGDYILYDVQIASGPDGTTVVWRDRVPASPPDIPEPLQRVWLATRPPGGTFGTPAVVSGDAYTFDAELATGPDGTTAVVWNETDTVPFIAFGAVIRPPGGSFGDPIEVVDGVQSARPRVAVGADGSVSVLYRGSLGGGGSGLLVKSKAPTDGSFGTPVEIPITGSIGNQSYRIEIAPDGTTTLIWRSGGLYGSVWESTRQPGGGEFSDPAQLSDSGHNTENLDFGFTPDGTAVAVWNEGGSVWAATRPPAGDFGEPLAIFTSDSGTPDPHLGLAADNSLNVIWTADSAVRVGSTLRPSFLLQVNRTGDGSGTVNSSDGRINCGLDCAEIHLSLARVTLTATPAAGSTFTGWSGGGCSGAGACELTMKEAATVTAEFTKDPEPPPAGEPKLGPLKIVPKAKKLKAGKALAIKVRVKNTGDATAANVKVCVKAPKKPVKVKKCVTVGKLAAGAARKVTFKARLTRKAKVGKKVRLNFTATAKDVAKKTGKVTLTRKR